MSDTFGSPEGALDVRACCMSEAAGGGAADSSCLGQYRPPAGVPEPVHAPKNQRRSTSWRRARWGPNTSLPAQPSASGAQLPAVDRPSSLGSSSSSLGPSSFLCVSAWLPRPLPKTQGHLWRWPSHTSGQHTAPASAQKAPLRAGASPGRLVRGAQHPTRTSWLCSQGPGAPQEPAHCCGRHS